MIRWRGMPGGLRKGPDAQVVAPRIAMPDVLRGG
jgi:hypothetical protein